MNVNLNIIYQSFPQEIYSYILEFIDIKKLITPSAFSIREDIFKLKFKETLNIIKNTIIEYNYTYNNNIIRYPKKYGGLRYALKEYFIIKYENYNIIKETCKFTRFCYYCGSVRIRFCNIQWEYYCVDCGI
jgi:hypothetical protein